MARFRWGRKDGTSSLRARGSRPSWTAWLWLIEGLGKAKEDGSTVHEALAFISFDHRAKTFRWHAFKPEGQIDTEAKVGTDRLEWSLDIPQRGRMRYTITRNEKGDWFEVGEMNQKDQTWRKFFEMTLRKEK